MAIAFVQAKAATSGASNVSTINVVFDAAPANGNVIFLLTSSGGGFCRIASDANITWFAAAPYGGGSSTFLQPFIGIVKTGSASATITVDTTSSTSLVAVAAEFSGVSPTPDRLTFSSAFNTTPDTGTTPTTTSANQLWLGWIVNRFANGTTFTSPTNSFSIVAQTKSTLNTTNDRSVALLYKIVGSTGAANTGVTADNGVWVGEMTTFPEASSGGTAGMLYIPNLDGV